MQQQRKLTFGFDNHYVHLLLGTCVGVRIFLTHVATPRSFHFNIHIKKNRVKTDLEVNAALVLF